MKKYFQTPEDLRRCRPRSGSWAHKNPWKSEEFYFEPSANFYPLSVLKVGGDFSTVVLSHMNKYGRIALCGCISVYNTIADLPLSE
jgi:hypothetical protein